jgi:hypothetical protein
MRIIDMSYELSLTTLQYSALQEIGKSPVPGAIPHAEAARLLELKLAYRLLGELRITAERRKRLTAGR